MDQAIANLNSLGDWTGTEPWLGTIAIELNRRHMELRSDMRENTNSWSYSEFCERLAYHFYNLACYYNDELFNKYKVDLESIKVFLENCLEKLTEVSNPDGYSDDTIKLKNDAQRFLDEIREIYENCTQKIVQTQSTGSNVKKSIKLRIVVGSLDGIPSQHCSNEQKHQIQNIMLIRVINTLEHAITVREHNNIFETAEKCDYLSQAYRVAGLWDLSRRYRLTSDNIKKNILSPKKPELNIDQKQKINDIIRKEIDVYKSNLEQVKSYIAEQFHQPLSRIDNAYVERKYIEYCATLWLQETTAVLKELITAKSRIVIQDIFYSLDSIKSLSQVPMPLNDADFYSLLMEHHELIAEEDQSNLIARFKKDCFDQILAYSESAKKELDLIERFINFLSSSRNLQSIIFELELNDFCQDMLSFGDLINNVMRLNVYTYDESLKDLQDATRDLREEDLFLIDKLKEILEAYTRPVKIRKQKIDGRLAVEVIGKNVVVSNILQQLENELLGDSHIEEVRFIADDIIHVDGDLKVATWHGKNVVVLTKTIKVYDKVTWDVSGESSNQLYLNNAGTDKDGNGKQGVDGYPGESGGNVSVFVTSIENGENFTIISNGGNGSKGQDGGNGKDGDDGLGIRKYDFDEKFPSPVNFMNDPNERWKRASNLFDNIKRKSLTIECQIKKRKPSNNVFIKASTNEGNEVVYSYCGGGFGVRFQSFILYKGSLGQAGGRGGECGLGGQGGYAGEIILKNVQNENQKFGVVKTAKQGEQGEKGLGGLYGCHGKNGWDMGFLDYQTWKNIKYYGTDKNSKLSLEYYDQDNSPSDRVWCTYKDQYVGIRAANIEHKKGKKYDERVTTRQNNNHKHHAQAVRKKNISQNCILANYSHHLTTIERNELQSLHSELEDTNRRALQAIAENEEQQEKQTTEISVKRHSHHQNINMHNSDEIISITSNTSCRNNADANALVDKLAKEPSCAKNWLQLRTTELNFIQIKHVLSVFEGSRSLLDIRNESMLRDIEGTLVDKCRLAVLQEIAEQLPAYQEMTSVAKLDPEDASKFLIEAKGNENNISHPNLGILNPYLFETNDQHREKIFQFCEEESLNDIEVCESFQRFVTNFIFEVGDLEGAHSSIKKYHTEYRDFLKNYLNNLKIYLEVFENAISKPGNEELYSLWVESIKHKYKKSEFKEEIKKDKYLCALYKRFDTQLGQKYDWNICCQDKDVRKEYRYYVQKEGTLLESYTDLVAYIFTANIRLYVKDQDSKLHLQSDHNPSAKRIINLLLRDNTPAQLDIDRNYLKLIQERKMQNELYAKILTEIVSLRKLQEFDDYLQSKTFLSKGNPSNDTQPLSEEKDIENIIEYFPEGDRQSLRARLEKITSQYIGQKRILHNMMIRFSSEGRYVSSQELYCLVNAILSSLNEDTKQLNIFAWIVAAYPQKKWIDELTLLRIENYFRQALAEKPKWRQYLSQIGNKDILLLFEMKLEQNKLSNPISVQCAQDILHLLSLISDETISLEGLELAEWPYALKEKYWTCKLRQLVKWKMDDLATASYYLMSAENIFGTNLTQKLLDALEEKKQELSSQGLTAMLSNFHHEKWRLSKDALSHFNNCTVHAWEQSLERKFIADKGERKLPQLVELIECDANTSKEIRKNLPEIRSCIEGISEYKIHKKPTGGFTESDITEWVKHFPKVKGDFEETYKDIFAVVDRAIELKRGFKLRSTQRLTVLALLRNRRNMLAQVSTGEGKSLIVVAASIMKAICRMKVDIITSSTVLARRDAEDNRDIYKLFGINVSHNCSEDIAKRKEAYSGNQVIYGDLSSFQRDYLLDKFYGKNILGDRNFENVIVDEVDSMLLDKGNNMLYLSHDLAGLDRLESVYIFIWQLINRPARDYDEIREVFDPKAIKGVVISDLYGLVKREDIATIGSELSESQKNIIWERLIESKIMDSHGKLLKESASDEDLSEIISGELNTSKDRLSYLLNERFKRVRSIHVPNSLRSFIEQHLESWINSAIVAYFMKEGENYVVDVDKTGTSPDRNPNIIILDTETGTDQANSQWDEALHQFLQLKHGCKLSLQSLKAVFISNVSFFKLYSHLYGLTGTLGSELERDLLQEIHNVDFVTIPTAKSKQFYERKPILCSGQTDWVNCIRSEVEKLTGEERRSVLIVCETVNEVEVLHKAFGGRNAKHVHTYTRDYEEFDRGFEISDNSKELPQGQIIIATNLAGRGTDIKITQDLRKAKGLHVCLTYLPSNVRVEQQAFGRAARCGDEGSGQLIIINSKGQGYSNSKVLDMKNERNSKERHRVSSIKSHYLIQITTEESLFQSFKEQYELLKNELDKRKVPSEVKEILMQSCLDKWAFWLDGHSSYIKDLTDELGKINLYKRLEEFLSHLKLLSTGYYETKSHLSDGTEFIIIGHDTTSWLAWVEGSANQMIKLGKYLSQNDKLKNAQQNAIQLFNDVIESEPRFSEAAHYYKAYALAKATNWEKITEYRNTKNLQDFKRELHAAERLLEEHSTFAIQAASIIGKIKKNNNGSIIQIDAYEEQQKSFANLYHMFSQSIANIFGHRIAPQSFVNSYVKSELAEVLYNDLLREGVLRKPRIKEGVSKEDLKAVSFGYGISIEVLKNFLSKHEGEDINEKQFSKMLKNGVRMPTRESFWKLMLQEKCLNEEIKYVIVDVEKLTQLDPSLSGLLKEKLNRGEIMKETFDQQQNWIFFNAECVERQKQSGQIFKKIDFIKFVGRDKYKVLKERGVFSFNKKAHIDPDKIESVEFPYYDSLTLEDFAKENITESDADRILLTLVEQGVIERKTGSEAHGLKVGFDKINEVRLSFCPVYEGAVKGLLHTCFSYRIALQKIMKHLEAKEPTESFQLMMKPHRNLILDLMEQKVISPAMVKDDPEKKLKSMYSQAMTRDDIKHMLVQDNLIPTKCTEQLLNSLIEKKWIVDYSILKTTEEKGVGVICMETAENLCTSFQENLYCIANPEKRSLPLNFSYGELKDIDKTVEKVLNDRLQLSNEETLKTIVSALKRSRSLLEALKVPDPNLKPLTELLVQGNFANIDEVHIFFLNGLDHLIQFEEKKWTVEMLWNTAIVVAMGVCQITAGALIELYSAGAMTHVGAGLINEGVSDIFFAAGALLSGHFSWSDYWQHKLVSLAMTTLTVGVGAYFSKGAKVSRFGHKIAGPNFEVGTKVAEMTGNKLIKEAGWKVVGKELIKRIVVKSVEGVAIGLANAAVDKLVENQLQALCEGLSSKILSNIDSKVDEHKISTTLEQAYRKLGRKKAKTLIDDLTKSVFERQSYVEQFAGIAVKLAGAINKGIGEAVMKKNKTSNKSSIPVSVISKIITIFDHTTHVSNIALITNEYLNKLNTEITDKLHKIDNIKHDKGQEKNKDYESFRKEVVDGWKSMLHEKGGQIIARHLVNPILKEGATQLVRHIGKQIKETYQSCKDDMCWEFFEELKEEHKQSLQKASKSRNASKIRKHVDEKYHKDLIKLMKKTRDPKLFAAIVRENVPMDTTCVNACAVVIHGMLQNQGVKRITIIVEGENGVRQVCSSGADGAEGLTIRLQLKDNHFQLAGREQSGGSSDSNNSCLFEAISKAKCLNMTSEEFRNKIADCIESNPKIQNDIKHGWHQFAISKGAIGGKRAYDKEITGKELYECIKDGNIKFSQSSIGEKTRDGLTLDQLGEKIKKDGWNGDPIKVVKNPDGTYTLLDHRRPLSVAVTASPTVKAKLAVYNPEDEFSSETCEVQYKTRNAGDAVKKRMRSGSLPDIVGSGFDSSYVRIRTTKDSQLHENTKQRLNEMKFKVGGPRRSNSVGSIRRQPRSRSVDRPEKK